GAQLDRGTDGLDVLRVGVEPSRAPAVEEGVDERGEPAGLHGTTSVPDPAARNRARCWRTFALPTVMPISAATSLSDIDWRNRSSRIRRYRSGSRPRTSPARSSGSWTGGGG